MSWMNRLVAPLTLGLILGLFPACEEDDVPGDTEGIARRENGWLRGDLHFHTPYSDGWDPVDVVVAVGEYLENPTFLAFNPEYEGNGLDFLVVTDHNNVECHSDPEFTTQRFEAIIRSGLKVHLVYQASIGIARDPVLLDLAARAGSYNIYIGFDHDHLDVFDTPSSSSSARARTRRTSTH